MASPEFLVSRVSSGLAVQSEGACTLLRGTSLDALFTAPDPANWLQLQMKSGEPMEPPERVLAPIQNQEVWASGVTYLRSRDARMQESKDSGGGSFYDRVYAAERPELFFKATPSRVVAPGKPMRLRSDSRWNVPEPELALAINAHGTIFGYTIGNDLSSRDIEGENPLYLPQAKVWSDCCALGPGILVTSTPPGPETAIELTILRGGARAFAGATALSQMKRTPPELATWLWRDNHFPCGCFLLTGTGLVPPDEFTLLGGDEVQISITGLGTLANSIA